MAASDKLTGGRGGRGVDKRKFLLTPLSPHPMARNPGESRPRASCPVNCGLMLPFSFSFPFSKICSNQEFKIHHVLLHIQGTLTYSCLSHSEQMVFESQEYVNCRTNVSWAPMPTSLLL